MKDIISYSSVEIKRKDNTILTDVNFRIGEGELIYLIGKVGAGKSTLLKSIYAEVPIACGHASVLNYDLDIIKKKDVPYLRRNIGFVFQDYQLLTDRCVYDNLSFVLKATGWSDNRKIAKRIREVLNFVGMAKKALRFPYELSGGEQQRIAIARAMLNEPLLILADEPTGNLDPDTGEQIMRRLYDIAAEGTTVIVATHNHGMLQSFPGRILECKNKTVELI